MILCVRKWAWLALAIVVTFVGATFIDDCAAQDDADCPPACHFACIDGCTVAPVEAAVRVPDASETRRMPQVESASSPLECDFPPNLIPPRA